MWNNTHFHTTTKCPAGERDWSQFSLTGLSQVTGRNLETQDQIKLIELGDLVLLLQCISFEGYSKALFQCYWFIGGMSLDVAQLQPPPL